jgi:hypothetical protein
MVSRPFFNSLIKVTAAKTRMGPNASSMIYNISLVLNALGRMDNKVDVEVIRPGVASIDHLGMVMRDGKGTELGRVLEKYSDLKTILSPTAHHERYGCC